MLSGPGLSLLGGRPGLVGMLSLERLCLFAMPVLERLHLLGVLLLKRLLLFSMATPCRLFLMRMPAL